MAPPKLTKHSLRLIACAAALSLCASLGSPPAFAQSRDFAETSMAKDTRIFELRTYIAAPGKLDRLHKRFRDHTQALFVKHGMTPVAFWAPVDQPNTMIYVLAFPSIEAKDKAWAAFGKDPEWVKVRSESEPDGSLVAKIDRMFMKAADYSYLK